jgi:hypothetical protein
MLHSGWALQPGVLPYQQLYIGSHANNLTWPKLGPVASRRHQPVDKGREQHWGQHHQQAMGVGDRRTMAGHCTHLLDRRQGAAVPQHGVHHLQELCQRDAQDDGSASAAKSGSSQVCLDVDSR